LSPKEQKPVIAVVGSNMMDLITYYENAFPRIGETVLGKDFEIGFGGKGANQAVAAAKLGAEVIMVTAVGDDLFGPLVRKNFEEQGISSRYVKIVPGKSSGVAPIFVDPQGRNSIFIIPGANHYLDPEDVTRARDALRRASFLLLQLEIKMETTYYAIELTRKLGIKTILNPAPAQKLDWEKLQGIYLFAPNETELENLTGISVTSKESIQEGIERLLEKGLENVVVTLGDKGAMLGNREGFQFFPAYQAKSIDTTGAGDAFLGALGLFLAEGKPLEESIDLACAYAALSTEKRGTQKSFVKRQEFEEWLANASQKSETW